MPLLTRLCFAFFLLFFNLLVSSCDSVNLKLPKPQKNNEIYAEFVNKQYAKDKKEFIFSIRVYNNSQSTIFIHNELLGLNLSLKIGQIDIESGLGYDGTWPGYIIGIKPKHTYTHTVKVEDDSGYDLSNIEGSLKYSDKKEDFAQLGYEGLKSMDIISPSPR